MLLITLLFSFSFSLLLQLLLLLLNEILTYLYHLVVILNSAIHDGLRIVHLPSPLSAHGVLVVAPAEHALVRTRHARRGLHAPMARYPIERVLVAAVYSLERERGEEKEGELGRRNKPAASTQHSLRPPAHLDTTVRS